MTSIHLPVSRLSPVSRSQPEPLGFLPVIQTANRSSLITQSEERCSLRAGRSPYRFLPRNLPTTRTILPSWEPGRVTNFSSVTDVAAIGPLDSFSGGPG